MDSPPKKRAPSGDADAERRGYPFPGGAIHTDAPLPGVAKKALENQNENQNEK